LDLSDDLGIMKGNTLRPRAGFCFPVSDDGQRVIVKIGVNGEVTNWWHNVTWLVTHLTLYKVTGTGLVIDLLLIQYY